MSNLAQRAITGLLLGGLGLTLVAYTPYGLLALAMIFSLLGYLEFFGISAMNNKVLRVVNLAFGASWWVVLCLDMALEINLVPLIYLLAIMQLPVNGIALLYFRTEAKPLETLGKVVLGFLYSFVPMILFFLMAFPQDPPVNLLEQGASVFPEWNYNPRISIGILLIVWSGDTFAYFGGRFLGKHKLFERISPKKTWEGAISGGLGSLLFAGIVNYFWPMGWNWFVVGVLVAFFSPWGDLVESMIKRSLDIKDSGTLLPGHGGVLDRFDGLYVAVPILWVYLMILGMI